MYLIFFKIYKYGKFSGDLYLKQHFLIEAKNRQRATRVAQLICDSSRFSMCLDPYPDLRTLRKIKSRTHLEKLEHELGFKIDDLELFSEDEFKEYTFPE